MSPILPLFVTWGWVGGGGSSYMLQFAIDSGAYYIINSAITSIKVRFWLCHKTQIEHWGFQ